VDVKLSPLVEGRAKNGGVLKKIFGLEREPVRRGRRNSIMKSFFLYSSRNISCVIKLRMKREEREARKIRNVHDVLVGKREGKAPFLKFRSGWEENITGYLKEAEFYFLRIVFDYVIGDSLNGIVTRQRAGQGRNRS
jgi:hypothetical protein